MHSDIHHEKQPPRRIGCLALIMNRAGEVLLVDPTYTEFGLHQLPGGAAHANEDPRTACVREVREETGLDIRLGHLLATDYMPRNESTGACEGYNRIYWGGVLTEEQIDQIRLPEPESGKQPELEGWAFIPLRDLDQYTAPYQKRRIVQAVAALKAGYFAELEQGYPVENDGSPSEVVLV